MSDCVSSFDDAKALFASRINKLTACLPDPKRAKRSILSRLRAEIEKNGTYETEPLMALIEESASSLKETESLDGLPLTIDSADHAVEVLTPVVKSMARRYGEDADDIEQEMWFCILRDLKAGKNETKLLIANAGFVRGDQCKKLHNAGLLPFRSEHPSPKLAMIPGVGLYEDDEGNMPASPYSEPSCTTVESSDALLEHMLSLCQTDNERAVVTAGARIKANHDWDADSVRLGILKSLEKETGLPARKIRAAQARLAKAYQQHYGHLPVGQSYIRCEGV